MTAEEPAPGRLRRVLVSEVGAPPPPPAGHKGTVIGCVLFSGTLVLLTDLAHGQKPTPRQIVGWVGAGFVLSLVADASPSLGVGLAALLTVSTVLTVGETAFTTIGKAVA